MGDSLGRVDRSADIVRTLEQIAAYLEEHRVEVMLATGDLFSDRLRQEQVRAAIAEIKRIFLPFLERGGTILAISGNHDNETFFETLRDALDLAAPAARSTNGAHATGRLYVAPNPRLIKLADVRGNLVQFVLMPYPTPRCYLHGERAGFRSIEERHRAIQQRFIEALNYLRRQVDPEHPCVLMSHVHVRGARLHSLFRLSEVEDVIFEPSDIPAEYAYVAYGHIHRAQEAVSGASHIRYAGSIERLEISEGEDEKSVVLFEIADSRLAGEPELLKLNSTPVYRVEISDPDAELPHLAERFKHLEPERALVQYTVHYRPDRHNLNEISRSIEAVFPRWYRRDEIVDGVMGSSDTNFAPERVQDVVGTVRDYLQMRLEDHDERDELIGLAEEMLAEGDWR
jgi:DNA repair exonuclease SbcCD nuclease subunit